jgi:hypothetical protein
MAHRYKADGPRGRQMSRASWARLDRAKERITRREGKAEAKAQEMDTIPSIGSVVHWHTYAVTMDTPHLPTRSCHGYPIEIPVSGLVVDSGITALGNPFVRVLHAGRVRLRHPAKLR